MAGDADNFPDLEYDVDTALVWKCPLSPDNNETVLYRDKGYQYVASSQELLNKNCSFVSNMLQLLSAFDEVKEQNEAVESKIVKRDVFHSSWFKQYHNLSAMYDWYKSLAREYSSNVAVKGIGKTIAGRDILAVVIGSDTNQPTVYFQCLLHPREWITGPMCMYLTQLFARADSSNNILFSLLQKYQFIIVPVANPDGYYLTWSSYPKYRFWRKNLSKNKGSSCLGVDLNRNFNIKWGKHGSSSSPCSDVYHGDSSGSELEVKAITSYLRDLPNPLIGAIDFHSFSQEIFYPTGWSTALPDNVQYFKYITQWMASAVNQNGRHTFTVGQMGALYLASGTFTDWLLTDDFINNNKDKYGHKYKPIPITIELPPTRTVPITGFMVPPEQILSICKEMTPAVIKFISLLKKQLL